MNSIIINNYWINNNLCVQVCEDDEGDRVFLIVNSESGHEEQISSGAAKVLCCDDTSTITYENWEDFCTASGRFCEDN